MSNARKGVSFLSSSLVCAGQAALEDLTATPQSVRQALIVAHRLSSWRLPPSVAGDLDTQQVALLVGAVWEGTAVRRAAGKVVMTALWCDAALWLYGYKSLRGCCCCARKWS